MRRRAAVGCSLLLLGLVLPCAQLLHAAPGTEPRSYLARAAELESGGKLEEAMEILREARELYASSDLLPEILLRSARVAGAQGERFRSRYFLAEVLRVAPRSAAAAQAASELGELLYAERRYAEALEAYGTAVIATSANGLDAQPARLKAAEIAALYLDQRQTARGYLAGVDRDLLDATSRELYGLVFSRAQWERIPTSTYGLEDPNVSALAVDADDLWVGTWSGGLARYSWSDGSSTVFREGKDSLVANTVRSICVTSRHVWVGTDQGLSQYSKALSTWRSVSEFGGSSPKKIQSVREIGGLVYVATLGDGLWLMQGEGWRRVGEGELSPYVTCLGTSRQGILVGTMDRGLLLLDAQGSAAAAGSPARGLPPRNITAVLEDAGGSIWVASYGEGLWRWDPGAGTVRHFDTASGEMGDDWVMCAAEGEGGTYFGTFGGGVSVLGRDGRWSRLGIADGLSAPDVMVAVEARGIMYFGTLGAGVSAYHEGLEP